MDSLPPNFDDMQSQPLRGLGLRPQPWRPEPPENPDAMLESVLTALLNSDGQPDRLFLLLHERWPHVRTTALIQTLLSAERGLTSTFRESARTGSEGPLALAAAIAIAEAANALELQRPGPYIRLQDLLAA